MYVLVDMEWISNQRGNHWPTQLAATRVDAQWNTVDIFLRYFARKASHSNNGGIWPFPAGTGNNFSMEKAFMPD